jgi:adenylosuccinate lyase
MNLLKFQAEERARLAELTPATYTGNAEQAKQINELISKI